MERSVRFHWAWGWAWDCLAFQSLFWSHLSTKGSHCIGQKGVHFIQFLCSFQPVTFSQLPGNRSDPSALATLRCAFMSPWEKDSLLILPCHYPVPGEWQTPRPMDQVLLHVLLTGLPARLRQAQGYLHDLPPFSPHLPGPGDLDQLDRSPGQACLPPLCPAHSPQ